MTACGSGGFVGDPSTIQNQTNGNASDANLQHQWLVAQQMIANGVWLNAFNGTNWTVDARALTTAPNGVTVTCLPDVTVAELARRTGNSKWLTHTDPSNTIFLGDQTVHGYADLGANKVVTACSGVGQIPGAPVDIGDFQYEAENFILYRLGYDVSNR